MCLPFDSKQPKTLQGKKCVFELQLIAFIQLALLFARSIVYFNLHDLFEILFVIFLWSAWSSLSGTLCFLYLLYGLCQIVLKGIFFATRFQHEVPVFGEQGREKVYLVLLFLNVIFYIIAQHIVFKAFKEFSAIELEQNYTVQDVESGERRQLQQKQPQNQKPNQAFYGRGVAIG